MTYTARRFLTFSKSQQSRAAMNQLKALYESLLKGQDSKELFQHYQEIASWIQLEGLSECSLETISNHYHEHLKIVQGSHKEHNLLPPIEKGDKLEKSPLFLENAIYLDHIRSAHNIGSMLRTIEAFALGQVHFSKMMAGPDHKQVKDAAMGAEKWLTIHPNSSFHDLPKPLIALETCLSAISLYDFIFPPSFTLAVGNEEYGCSKEVIESADILIYIPMEGRKNSLNVANALAIAAAEIRRQRLDFTAPH